MYRQINTDLRAARCTVAGTHRPPMRAHDRVDKCQPQPVSSRLSALGVALEHIVQHFRRKPWPIIFNNENCRFHCLQVDFDIGSGGKVNQFVIKQVRDHAVNKRRVGQDHHGSSGFKIDGKISIDHAWVVQIDHGVKRVLEIHFAQGQSQGVSIGFCDI